MESEGFTAVSYTHLEVYLYADFLSTLFAETDNFSKYVLNAVLEDENAYILKYGHKKLGSHYDEALNMSIRIPEKVGAWKGC